MGPQNCRASQRGLIPVAHPVLKSRDLKPASKLARPARYHARTRDMTQGPCASAESLVGFLDMICSCSDSTRDIPL